MIRVHSRDARGNFQQVAEAPYVGTEVTAKAIRLIIGGVIIDMTHDEAAELAKAIPERLAAHRAPVAITTKTPRKPRAKKTA